MLKFVKSLMLLIVKLENHLFPVQNTKDKL